MFLRNSERGNWVGNGGEGAERGVSGQAQRGEAAIQDVGPSGAGPGPNASRSHEVGCVPLYRDLRTGPTAPNSGSAV